jgi:hypothetical protein
MEPQEFISMMTRFSKPGLAMTPTEDFQMVRLSAALQQFLRAEFVRLVQYHLDEPISVSYINDGWGRMLTDRVVRKVPESHVRVCRNGKLRHEFLLQRAVLRIDTFTNREVVKILVGEPIGMRLGKKSGNVFTAACEFLGTLRQSGHRGVCINVYLQDGLLHECLTRLFNELYYLSGVDLGDSAEQFRDTDWTFSIKCSSHACANSLDKAFGVLDNKKVLVNELHIVTCSFINGSHNLHRFLDEFVFTRLRFRREFSGSEGQRFAFWRHFVEQLEMVDLLVQLDLTYADGFN